MVTPHALIVPGPGQGHLNSCMLLADSLSSVGFSISLVFFSTSHSDLQRRNRLPSLHNSSIRFHVVPDGLDAHNAPFFVSNPEMQNGLQQLVEKLSRDEPVTCIISDSFVSWTQNVADKCGLPRIDYWTSNAFSYLMICCNMGVLHEKGILPAKGSRTSWKSEYPQMVDCIPGLPPFPVDHYPKELRFGESSEPLVRFCVSIGDYAKRAERVLIHTVQELEPTALAAVGMAGIPVYPIGPLLHHVRSQQGDPLSDESCLKWLDTQADSSVIYVAFGSYAALLPEEIKELALGLEASEQPFLWVIRVDALMDQPDTVCTNGVLFDVLPEGFMERIKGRGKIIEWAPQAEVLKHAAVGGFLTHCGWNSTMESIWEGVPLLGCPRGAEQNANASYIAQDWKMGIELERTENGGLDRRDVERGVRALMQEEGRKARCRAEELKKAAREACVEGGTSRTNLQKFYEDMCLRVTCPQMSST